MNVDLLYDYKTDIGACLGVQLVEPETTYGAMIETLLAMDRSSIANQARDKLAEVGRKNGVALHIANARISLHSGDLEDARTSLEQVSRHFGW